MNNRVIRSNTKKTAVDQDPENFVDIIRRILDEMNERAKRCKKHDFEYQGLCIDDPEHPFDVFTCKYCGKEVAEGVENSSEDSDYLAGRIP
jgi:dihydropteroate synthase